MENNSTKAVKACRALPIGMVDFIAVALGDPRASLISAV